MNHPAEVLPSALQAIQNLQAALDKTGLAPATRNLVALRASQINGSSPCIDAVTRMARKDGETNTRLLTVTVWRKTPHFTDAERAALALTEAVTRLDETDPVPDDLWDEVTRHFDEQSLAALLLTIAATNTSNRLNVSTRQVAGA